MDNRNVLLPKKWTESITPVQSDLTRQLMKCTPINRMRVLEINNLEGLDWMIDSDKVMMDWSAHENL